MTQRKTEEPTTPTKDQLDTLRRKLWNHFEQNYACHRAHTSTPKNRRSTAYRGEATFSDDERRKKNERIDDIRAYAAEIGLTQEQLNQAWSAVADIYLEYVTAQEEGDTREGEGAQQK